MRFRVSQRNVNARSQMIGTMRRGAARAFCCHFRMSLAQCIQTGSVQYKSKIDRKTNSPALTEQIPGATSTIHATAGRHGYVKRLNQLKNITNKKYTGD